MAEDDSRPLQIELTKADMSELYTVISNGSCCVFPEKLQDTLRAVILSALAPSTSPRHPEPLSSTSYSESNATTPPSTPGSSSRALQSTSSNAAPTTPPKKSLQAGDKRPAESPLSPLLDDHDESNPDPGSPSRRRSKRHKSSVGLDEEDFIQDHTDTSFDSDSGDSNRQSNVKQTPSQRATSKKSAPASLRKRVEQNSPQHGRCIITNIKSPECTVQISHTLPRSYSADEDLMENIEVADQVPPRRFNADSSSNATTMTADWHLMADKGLWALCPDHRVIRSVARAMQKLAKNCPKPDKNMVSFRSRYRPRTSGRRLRFKYYLLCLDEESMKTVNLYRRTDDGTNNSLVDTLHQFPFTSLGKVKSQIYPHFAIFELGKKLDKILKGLSTTDQVLFKKKLTTSWMRAGGEPQDNQNVLEDILQVYNTMRQASKLFYKKPGHRALWKAL
ncbi:hypothetical protein MIND_00991700 [Mycena indigotica]|uniref:HNH nuclease domain-containing protein n=1 Tax=Mycena indigotica TaxID=2126181 RepID=A0A8H6SA31_9AGAR|nr:uncharacterized protein MIND_00991700 [Mycena indigotica]KAF7294552.1 hypothetical protein MIND_00991700 [Mycena indigotica]